MDPEKVQLTDGTVETDLLSAVFHGIVDKEPVPAFTPLYITVTELNSKLQNVLKGLKELFNIPISFENGVINFRLIGPVKDPEVVFDKQNDGVSFESDTVENS